MRYLWWNSEFKREVEVLVRCWLPCEGVLPPFSILHASSALSWVHGWPNAVRSDIIEVESAYAAYKSSQSL